MIWDNII